jgi:2,4-dienoyl-CoA reductase-like NADH-dependent reductase (Old Yellow Enzyme family)
MGVLELRNRIVMAPLTRMRAANSGHAPTKLHAEYYAQRASAGLIIGECTEISPDAYGWGNTPGLWNAEQVRGWRGVTDAVHNKGSFMYAALAHWRDVTSGLLRWCLTDVRIQCESGARECYPLGTEAHRSTSPDEQR